MKIAIASDHGGFELKQQLQAALSAEWTDFGTTSGESCDYPDYAVSVA
jgi:ribose 5-phosphate isomerase B